MGAESKKGLNALRVHKTTCAGKYHDNKGHGLYLVVAPDGRRRWEQRITVGHRRRTLGLGRYPDVSLCDARRRALRNYLLVADGVDPLVHKRAQNRRVPTFAEAVEEVIALRRSEWTAPHQEKRWRRSLEIHVCPTLGHLLVSEIHTQDVVKVLKMLRERLPKSVPRVRQQISAVLSWAVGIGYRSHDPCGSALEALMPGKAPQSENHPALPYDQVPDALERVRGSRRWIGERLLLEFLVLTAVRTNEARGALLSEIDWSGRRWTVPAERMKERRQHEVPLSRAALAVLREARDHPDMEAVRHRRGAPGLVFPTRNGRELYNNGLAHFVKELELDCVPHGFRSSFSTWSAEAGNDFDLTDICLSHAVGSEVSRRYRRTGLFVPRIPIMEDWGCYVASVRSVGSGDLVPTVSAVPGVSPRVSHFTVNQSGRDFVVGDVHGCFRTLERALAELAFDPGRDRLFGVGDLVNRGPHSGEALHWLEVRFDAVALGNHDRAVLPLLDVPPGTPPPSDFEWWAAVDDVDRGRWRAALVAMPIAITVETPYGAVGIVHAEVPHLEWPESIAMIARGDPGAVDVALLGLPGSGERARAHESSPVGGLRALVHGHEARSHVGQRANRWNIDTGAGISRLNRLTILHVNGRRIRASRFPVAEST